MSSEQQHRKPSINLDNYEEFFLLYIDQELSDADKKEVDSFVELHPELKEELSQLLLTKCLPENLPVFDKSTLFKNHVDATNVESLQLLFIDDELDSDSIEALQDYMSTHPAAKENLHLLREAKLPAEQILFPDKEKLLRNNHGRGIILRRISYSIAASLILFLGLRMLLPQNPLQKNFRDPSSVTIAADESLANKKSIHLSYIKETSSPKPVEVAGLHHRIKTSEERSSSDRYKISGQRVDADNITSIGEKITSTEQTVASEMVAVVKTNNLPVTEIAARTNNLPVRDMNRAGSSEQITSSTTNTVSDFEEHVKDNYATEALTNVRFANYRDQEEDESDQERKGFKNIIRKANRLYNKVTHPEPDKTIFRFAKTEIGIPR